MVQSRETKGASDVRFSVSVGRKMHLFRLPGDAAAGRTGQAGAGGDGAGGSQAADPTGGAADGGSGSGAPETVGGGGKGAQGGEGGPQTSDTFLTAGGQKGGEKGGGAAAGRGATATRPGCEAADHAPKRTQKSKGRATDPPAAGPGSPRPREALSPTLLPPGVSEPQGEKTEGKAARRATASGGRRPTRSPPRALGAQGRTPTAGANRSGAKRANEGLRKPDDRTRAMCGSVGAFEGGGFAPLPTTARLTVFS